MSLGCVAEKEKTGQMAPWIAVPASDPEPVQKDDSDYDREPAKRAAEAIETANAYMKKKRVFGCLLAVI